MPCYCAEMRKIQSDLTTLGNIAGYAIKIRTSNDAFDCSLEDMASHEISTFADVDNQLLKQLTIALNDCNSSDIGILLDSISAQQNHLENMYRSYSIADRYYHEELAAVDANI